MENPDCTPLYWVQPLCRFLLFPLGCAVWCRGHLAKLHSRAFTDISKVPGIWVFHFFFVFTLIYNLVVTVTYFVWLWQYFVTVTIFCLTTTVYHCDNISTTPVHILRGSYSRWNLQNPIYKITKLYIEFLTLIIWNSLFSNIHQPTLRKKRRWK